MLVLVLVAAAPAFIILLNFHRELRAERMRQARQVAERQTELIDESLRDALTSSQTLLQATAGLPAVVAGGPACSRSLSDLRLAVPIYGILAVVDAAGRIVCNSAAQAITDAAAASISSLASHPEGFAVGSVVPSPVASDGVVMLAWVRPASAGPESRALVAGLSLGWLGQRLQRLLGRPDARFIVADASGTVVVGPPGARLRAGDTLPPMLQQPFSQELRGVLLQDLNDSKRRVVGYLPPGQEMFGFFVASAFDLADLGTAPGEIAGRDYATLAAANVFSLLLLLFGRNRYVRQPAVILVEAARRWARGDLDARVRMPRGTTREFRGLAIAFNRMAGILKRQRVQLQGMNEALEVRVAERTGALLDSNNRLQVEIAEREMSDANLRQAQKLQAVGQLAAGIAHNFNNLLSAMLGSLELLQKRLPGAGGNTDPGAERLLEIAKTAVARGSWLTAQLLAFSRKQPLLAKPVDLGEAIEGMQTLLQSTLGPDLRVVAQIDPALWPAMVDPHHFEVAILNLALNAREAMHDDGQLVISASNEVVASPVARADLAAGDYVRVDVADTGMGMPPDVAFRAFEPFFTTKDAGDGAGLGLSQVHGMVTQLGGAVSIESRVGEGTRVRMLLPRSLVRPPRRRDEKLGLAGPALGRGQMVLLVDDDDEVREVTAGVLEDRGYWVVAAADGPSALSVLEREDDAVALVIADYAMPGMTGIELLRHVRRRRPHMPFLLATGYADSMSLAGDNLPSDQIVRKPFRSAELLARVEMVIERQATLAG